MRIGPFGKKVAGYCHVCGSLEDEQHLTQHDGKAYCSRCYRPIAAQLQEEERRTEIRKRHGRHHLVVEFLDGRTEQGRSLAFNVKEPTFRLDCEDDAGAATGRTVAVDFDAVKCVRNVKSYSGHSSTEDAGQAVTPGGIHVVVEFSDGEILEGSTTTHVDARTSRFHVVPRDPNSNDISVLVSVGAIVGVYSPEEFRAKQTTTEAEAPVHSTKDTTPVGQDESMGDFYFETHNYPSALEQYKTARREHPESKRLRRKTVVATINIGIQFIKQRDFKRALEYMDAALALEPDNPHAEKKAKQLRKTIAKTERRMREYMEQHSQNQDTMPGE